MKQDLVFLEPIHMHAYRREYNGIPVIRGVYYVEPKGLDGRVCYEVEYEDGFIDHVPVLDVMLGHYKFVVQ